jgi:hypothetical protein
LLAATYARAGQLESARHELALAREGKADLTVSYFAKMHYVDDAFHKHIEDGLRMAGLTGDPCIGR